MTSRHKKHPNLAALVDYRKHASNDEGQIVLPLSAYALHFLTPDLLIALPTLFYPDFIEHREGIFLRERFNADSFDGWYRGFKGDVTQVEHVMNHVHLAEDWQHGFAKMDQANLVYFGEILMLFWSKALQDAYPGRAFVVEGQEEGNYDYVVTFWQRK